MARIQTYTVDTEIQDNDLLIGTDSQTGLPTRNFRVGDLKDFIGQGEDVREYTGANYLPNISENGLSVESSQISQEIATGGVSSNVTFSGSSSDPNYVLARVLYQSPDTVLEIYDWKQPYFIDSFVGRTFTITAGQLTFTGTVLSKIDESGLPSDSNTDSSITDAEPISQDVGGVVRRVDRFILTLTGGSTPDANELVSDMIIGPGLRSVNISIAATVDSGATTISGDISAQGNATLLGNVILGSEPTSTGDDPAVTDNTLLVRADSTFFGDIEVGTSADTSVGAVDHTVTVHGDIVVPSNEGSITVGAGTDKFSIATADGSNVTISQSGSSTLTVDGNKVFSGNTRLNETVIVGSSDPTASSVNVTTIDNQSLNITTVANTGNTVTALGPGTVELTRGGDAYTKLRRVTANDFTESQLDAMNPDPAQLTSITIGEQQFNLPELSAGVAQALPGLNEVLEGPTAAITIGRFFFGLEQSTGATNIPQAGDLAPATITGASGIDLAAGAITFTVPTANRRAFGDRRTTGRDADLMMFFVASTYTADIGTTLTSAMTEILEVISYDQTSGVATLGRLGGGILNLQSRRIDIAGEEVIFTGIPADSYDNTTHRFLTVRTSNETGQLASAALQIEGVANGAQYELNGGASTNVSSIEYEGNHNISTGTTTNDLVIDISGRFQVLPTQTNSDLHTVTITQNQLFGILPLDRIPANPSGTFTTSAVAPIGADTISVADATGIASGSTFTVGATTYTIEGVDVPNNALAVSPDIATASIASGTMISWSRDYAGVVALPAAVPGDAIKILNTSTFTTTGTQTSGTWRIVGNATQPIMKAASGLNLDDQTASFELIYVDDTIGWGIFGIN